MEACPSQDQELQEHYIIFSMGVLTVEKVARMLPIRANYCTETQYVEADLNEKSYSGPKITTA